MKLAYVVVEGETDADILRSVLDPKLLIDVGLVPAGGIAYIPSLARSLLVRRSIPVAIFADSDSLDKHSINDRRTQFKGLLNAVARSTSTEVILAVPEIEAIFFTSPDIIKKVFGRTIPELLALGPRDPKGVLNQLSSMNQIEWNAQKVLKQMSIRDLEQLRQAQPIKDLTKFLELVQTNTKIASS
jgi:hypothetical protein